MIKDYCGPNCVMVSSKYIYSSIVWCDKPQICFDLYKCTVVLVNYYLSLCTNQHFISYRFFYRNQLIVHSPFFLGCCVVVVVFCPLKLLLVTCEVKRACSGDVVTCWNTCTFGQISRDGGLLFLNTPPPDSETLPM